MIIIASALYPAAVSEVIRQAGKAPGCLDFRTGACFARAGPHRRLRRWESDDHLHLFRTADGPALDVPPLRSANVHKYRIATIEEP